jgi:hypothetical protein
VGIGVGLGLWRLNLRRLDLWLRLGLRGLSLLLRRGRLGKRERADERCGGKDGCAAESGYPHSLPSTCETIIFSEELCHERCT